MGGIRRIWGRLWVSSERSWMPAQASSGLALMVSFSSRSGAVADISLSTPGPRQSAHASGWPGDQWRQASRLVLGHSI